MNIYIYDKKTKVLVYQDSGGAADIVRDIPVDCDFTLTPPPNTHEKWRWIDNKWVADDTAS